MRAEFGGGQLTPLELSLAMAAHFLCNEIALPPELCPQTCAERQPKPGLAKTRIRLFEGRRGKREPRTLPANAREEATQTRICKNENTPHQGASGRGESGKARGPKLCPQTCAKRQPKPGFTKTRIRDFEGASGGRGRPNSPRKRARKSTETPCAPAPDKNGTRQRDQRHLILISR